MPATIRLAALADEALGHGRVSHPHNAIIVVLVAAAGARARIRSPDDAKHGATAVDAHEAALQDGQGGCYLGDGNGG